MRDLAKRIERLEMALQDGACVCQQPESIPIVIEEGWNGPSAVIPDPSRPAEAALAFTCPVHGRRMPAWILRLSRGDAAG